MSKPTYAEWLAAQNAKLSRLKAEIESDRIRDSILGEDAAGSQHAYFENQSIVAERREEIRKRITGEASGPLPAHLNAARRHNHRRPHTEYAGYASPIEQR